MALVRDLVDLIASRTGAPHATVAAIAEVLGLSFDDEADVDTAARLIIGVLATDDPSNAAERVATYAELPMTHLGLMNVPHPDGIGRNATIAAEDLSPSGPRGADKLRAMKSLAGRLAVDIEALMRGDDDSAVPYMIKVSRRATAPLAMVGVFAKDRSEQVALFRNTSDEEHAYSVASLRLNINAEVHGVILAEIADILRGAPLQRAAPGRRRARSAVAGGRI